MPSAPTSPELVTELPARLRAVIGQLSRRLRDTEAGLGLTPTKRSVLFTVVRDGPLRMAELAAVEALNPTMLSRAVAALVEAGLVERRCDPDDRRAAIVTAAPAGRRLRERIRSERNDVLRRELGALNADERARLLDALPLLETLAERLRDRRP